MNKIITLDITTYNLGDNSEEDNAAYRLAVEGEIESQFPGTTVEVNLISGTDSDRADALGFGSADTEVEAVVLQIAQDVWNEAAY